MKTVIYAGIEFVTGDDIASALFGCGQALAEAGEAETVSIPTVEPDGAISSVTVLIGPASQIVMKSAQVDVDELVDVTAVAHLDAIRHRLRPVARIDGDRIDQTDWGSELGD